MNTKEKNRIKEMSGLPFLMATVRPEQRENILQVMIPVYAEEEVIKAGMEYSTYLKQRSGAIEKLRIAFDIPQSSYNANNKLENSAIACKI